MKTILSHFYNEEYLLPWWLEHHKKYFDHGILVDQRSTDNSVNIIKSICPTWEVIQSRNDLFDCCGTDSEMQELESKLTGWRATLTTTEFLCGNYDMLDKNETNQYVVKAFIMVDLPSEKDQMPTYDKPLIEQKSWGYWDNGYRPGRSIHTKEVPYRFGRHCPNITTEELAIFWYGWSPWTEGTKKRKLQIQHRIPEIDVRRGFGGQHHVNEQQLEDGWAFRSQFARFNMKEYFPKAYA
jgi:hypothetical protein